VTVANSVEPLSISVTDIAAKKVEFFAQKQGLPEGFGLKVAVKGGGCSGMVYTLSIEEGPDSDDRIIDDHGIRIFVPKRSFVFLAGTELDFSDGLNGKGFVFNNPNAKSSCGCGNSFSV
jgi:iron-sulfur cluster assembly protein